MDKVYCIYVHLADNEWGNELMLKVAEETFAIHKDKEPLLVYVYEHAGWFLVYAKINGEIKTVGSANDGAKYYGDVAAFREKIYRAKFEYLEPVYRNK